MKWNKLLERQLRKFLPGELRDDVSISKFLSAVNDSYDAYERDNDLANRAFKISEEEYVTINKQLQVENELKKLSINRLKETITGLGEKGLDHSGDDLLDIVTYLETQIDKRKNAEEELLATANRLSSLIINLQSGVLLENENRHIILTNQFFCDIFGIPVAPELLIGSDCTGSAEQSKHLFKTPDAFVRRVNELVHKKELVLNEEIELVDGRVLERNYVPIFIQEEYKGHLWQYEDITERKNIQKKIEQSELKNRLIMNGALDAIITIDLAGYITYWNPQAENIFGWKEKEMLGKKLSDTIIPPEARIAHEKGIVNYLKTGQGPVLNRQIELTALCKEGREFPIELSIIPIKQNGDEFFCSFIRDISARKKAEEDLKKISLIASANKNGVVFTNSDGTIFWCNEGFCKLTGFDMDEIIGQTPVQLLKGELTDKKSLQLMVDLFTGGNNFDIEIVCYKKNGSAFWGKASGQSVVDSNGKVLQYFSMVEDITKEKETQEQLREFESRFREALEKIGDNVWEHDFKTGKTYFSNTSNHLLGYALDTTVNNAELWWKQTHPEDVGMLLDNNSKYLSGGISHHTLEYRVIAKDGTIRWVLDRGVVIEKESNGKPLRIVGTHTDITERKLSEQALQINEEKYRGIIANMNLGLLEVDNEENIQYANQSFCEMSGYEIDELLGKKASLLFAKGENQEMIETKNDLRKKGLSDVYEVAVKNKRGQLKWWLISGAPRYNDGGDLIGSIGIHLDITSQKILEMDLYDARESAEQSARAKEIFLANMSHEIRTPMNAILGMGRQLNKSELNEQQRFYLQTINKAADHLLVVINDILDISKIEAGKLNLEYIGFKPNEVIQHCVEVMLHRSEEKGLRLHYENNFSIYPVYIGDPYRLTQILLNLISNAIKFTDKGSVTIKSEVVPTVSNTQTLMINVTDTGIGMEESFLKNLFQKFTQEDKTVARKYGGTGLGMSISRQLTELMNGHIDVKSIKGKGTTVTINIPFTIGNAADLPLTNQVLADSSILSNKKILLVEDNEMNRLVATTVLNNYGVLLNEVTNGQEAVDELQHSSYDLILMDVQMPVMNGLEATAFIRKNIDQKIPIIALTANAIKGESDRCIEAGMNDYVSKPFEEEDLVYIMAKWLSNRTPEKQQLSTHVHEKGKEVSSIFNLSGLEKISHGNRSFVTKMISLFIEQVPAAVKDIRSAYEEKNHPVLKTVAHRIKPAIDNMGIASLYSIIREIEKHDPASEMDSVLEEKIFMLEKTINEVVEQLGKMNPIIL